MAGKVCELHLARTAGLPSSEPPRFPLQRAQGRQSIPLDKASRSKTESFTIGGLRRPGELLSAAILIRPSPLLSVIPQFAAHAESRLISTGARVV